MKPAPSLAGTVLPAQGQESPPLPDPGTRHPLLGLTTALRLLKLFWESLWVEKERGKMATGGKTPLSAQSWPQNSHRSLATVGHSRSQADGQQHNPQDSFSCGHSPGTAELTPSAQSTPETSHECWKPTRNESRGWEPTSNMLLGEKQPLSHLDREDLWCWGGRHTASHGAC